MIRERIVAFLDAHPLDVRHRDRRPVLVEVPWTADLGSAREASSEGMVISRYEREVYVPETTPLPHDPPLVGPHGEALHELLPPPKLLLPPAE